MKKVAIFPGSFDPFTLGHHDIVMRGVELFDEVIIAIGYNTNKSKRYFDIDLIVDKIKETYKDLPQVKVVIYSELTSSLAKKNEANFLLRGLRNTTDFEYENAIAQMNRHLNKDLETVFLITSPKYSSINSTILREVHRYGGEINEFLPYEV
ncbi:pantetheine-phosphate adenylyltransferase [Litoribacter ruber]|uniref:Phosphopantetheine adenylyltransferase n=1 Tax=Litoribacter ruber TaxID=702568 RepID=A0AAP2CG33_9BACT|nr:MULTISPECIES: pantetheine-phosphate adenylyltransferase [Litoribacter]MBS9522854.1 pantetheine-phosphate adenylyltransferase [Litoribacter alkaliphilus]MBT0812361.1 pantetheine-phosphate adenylyltransferase [Litoribacter ruber]